MNAMGRSPTASVGWSTAPSSLADADDALRRALQGGDGTGCRTVAALAAIAAAMDDASDTGRRPTLWNLLRAGAEDLALRVIARPGFTADGEQDDIIVSGAGIVDGQKFPRVVAALMAAGADPFAQTSGREPVGRDDPDTWPGSHAAMLLDAAGPRRRDVLVALIRSHAAAVADPARRDRAIASWRSGLRGAVIMAGREDHGIVDLALPIAVADDDALRLLAAVGAP